MRIKIGLQRSNEWVAQQRLETGVNVPKDIEVEVDPAELSIAARKVVLDRNNGTYRDTHCLVYGGDSYASRVKEYFNLDENEPTALQISNTIIGANVKFDSGVAVKKREEAERKAEREAKDKAKREKEAAIKEARVILKNELDNLAVFKELFKDACNILSDFPACELIHACENIGLSSSRQAEFEDASHCYLFTNRDDEN